MLPENDHCLALAAPCEAAPACLPSFTSQDKKRSAFMGDTVATLGGHLTMGTITSIKVVVVIGVIEESNIKAEIDPRLNQTDLKLSL